MITTKKRTFTWRDVFRRIHSTLFLLFSIYFFLSRYQLNKMCSNWKWVQIELMGLRIFIDFVFVSVCCSLRLSSRFDCISNWAAYFVSITCFFCLSFCCLSRKSVAPSLMLPINNKEQSERNVILKENIQFITNHDVYSICKQSNPIFVCIHPSKLIEI